MIIWAYEVQPSRTDEFIDAYGPDGEWARLFRRSPDFIGVELIANDMPNRYTTIDRWETETAWHDFMDQNGFIYREMDRRLDSLTTTERLISRGPTIS